MAGKDKQPQATTSNHHQEPARMSKNQQESARFKSGSYFGHGVMAVFSGEDERPTLDFQRSTSNAQKECIPRRRTTRRKFQTVKTRV
jgi:hypothetical protein